MAAQNFLIMNLLRIITPEEIADIATKHNGGKFLSLTDLVNERVERNIYRDFSGSNSMDEIHEEHAVQSSVENTAKILPFKIGKQIDDEAFSEKSQEEPSSRFVVKAIATSQVAHHADDEVIEDKAPKIEHKEDENMSSFIMVEKARLKQSQKSLKQKEIISLYQKNSTIDVEQIKTTNQTAGNASEIGVLVNKKQY